MKRTGGFGVPGFRPNKHYMREMKRFGILPDNYGGIARGRTVDGYAIDQAYWRSLWWPYPRSEALKADDFLRP